MSRVLFRSPGFALAVILTLMLGIGANTAIFSIVHALLLRPLPFPDADRLVSLYEAVPEIGFSRTGFSPPDFKVLREQQQSMEGVAAFVNARYEITGGDGEPARIEGTQTTAGLFEILGVAPLLGRTFQEEDDVPDSRRVIVSYALWQSRYAGDPGLVGRTILLDRVPYTVIAVMPQGFRFPLNTPGLPIKPADIWVPRGFTPEELVAYGSLFNHSVVGRLKPEVDFETLQTECRLLVGRMQDAYPARLLQFLRGAQLQVGTNRLQTDVVGLVTTPLLILMAAVGGVLLIGCANIANLVLARGAGRRKEIALRYALGAGKSRVVRQLLGESLTLALIGGVLGVALSAFLIPALLSLSPADLPMGSRIMLNPAVVAFGFGLALLTVLLSSLLPSFSTSRVKLNETLQESSRGSTSRLTRNLQGTFVVAQMTLAIVLLVGAGLLVRSFVSLVSTDPGFRSGNLLVLNIRMPLGAYAQAGDIRNFYNRLLQNVSALPGVIESGYSTDRPLQATEGRGFRKENEPWGAGTAPPAVSHSWIHGDYLQALGVPLISGRLFTPEDRRGATPVVIISRSMAETFWPGEDPLGERIEMGGPGQIWTIIGVVGNVKDAALGLDPRPHTYVPYQQEPDPFLVHPTIDLLRQLNLTIRTGQDPQHLIAPVRQELKTLDPNLAVAEVATMDTLIRSSLGPQRFSTVILGAFSLSALLLSALGLYGVISYSVTQRTQEVGIRMALGATQSNALGMILSHGLRLSLISIGLGLLSAFLLTRVMSSLLYGVSTHDPVTFFAVPAILGLVAITATWVPARRAARIDPLKALRYE